MELILAIERVVWRIAGRRCGWETVLTRGADVQISHSAHSFAIRLDSPQSINTALERLMNFPGTKGWLSDSGSGVRP